MPLAEILEAWNMSHGANRFLLNGLSEEQLDARYGARTRTARAQFCHMHNVRHRWLMVSAPQLIEGWDKFGKREAPEKALLLEQLDASSESVAAFLEACTKAGKVKNWKGGVTSFLAYLVAHEAHHRGLVMVALRSAGLKADEDLMYGQWDWGKLH